MSPFIQPWKWGDRVRFAHQHPDGPIYTVTEVIDDHGHPMVALEGMVGQFGSHIFVAYDYPRDSIVPRPPRR